MKEIFQRRDKIALGILVLFTAATVFSYGAYTSDIDIEANMTDKITSNDSSLYRGFNYSLKNSEKTVIESIFYIVGPRQRGETRMITDQFSLQPEEKKTVTALMQENRDFIPPGGDYMLIIKDNRTGRFDSRIMSFDNDYLSKKNPYFVETPGYTFHWTGSIYGNGNYSMNYQNKGLNASFNDCNSTCGFNYRDEYELTERVVISGRSKGVSNKSELTAVIAGEEFEIELKNNDTGIQRFEEEIDLDQKFDSKSREQISYEIDFRTREKEFHWIQINEYRFYNPE